MSLRVWLSAAWLTALLGCTPQRTTPASPIEPEPGPTPAMDEASAQASAAPDRARPIALDVPLLSGDAESLAVHRGRVVVLLLSSTDRPGWSAFREHFEDRLRAVGSGRLSVIVVANDVDPRALQTEWDRDPPPFVLGWDPDGALALRLGVASLPAAFILDAQGHPLGNVAQLDAAGFTQLDAWVDEALPGT